jgi:hypothetical protein
MRAWLSRTTEPALRKRDRSTAIGAGSVFPLAFLSKRNYLRQLTVLVVEIPVLGVRIGRGPVQYNALASDHANELDRLLRV